MDSKEVSTFINQFPAIDRSAFRYLIEKLVYVPNSELHRFYRNSILTIIQNENHKIAVFPLEKKFFRMNQEIIRDDKEYRINYDSSVVIGRILHSLEQEFGKDRLIVSPTLKTLKAERIKTYVFVEDLVGSGKRINDFWVKHPTSLIRTLKSLISFKICNAYLVSYGMTGAGLKSLQKQSKSSFKEILYARYSKDIFDYLDYDSYQTIKKISGNLGFRDAFSPIIFEHGCHNCLPLVFWKKIKKWNPLFPSRSVPPYLTQYFIKKNNLTNQIATALFDKGLVRIPLILNDLTKLQPYEKTFVIPILALKAKGYTDRKILSLLMLESDIFHQCIDQLIFLLLLDRKHQITERGEDFLSKLDKKFKIELKKIPGYTNNDIYIPSQFGKLKQKI